MTDLKREEEISHHTDVLMYHDTGRPEFQSIARRFAELWENLVPERGQANTLQGEILRAVGRLAGEDRRNGNMNWDEDCERLVHFLRDHLTGRDAAAKDQARERRVADDLDAVMTNGRDGIDYKVIRVVFGRLIESAVEYCEAHREPIAKANDPALGM